MHVLAGLQLPDVSALSMLKDRKKDKYNKSECFIFQYIPGLKFVKIKPSNLTVHSYSGIDMFCPSTHQLVGKLLQFLYCRDEYNMFMGAIKFSS